MANLTSQRTMAAHYEPNWKLTQAHNLKCYNCGYAESPGSGTFDEHQQSLVFHLIGDTHIGPESTVLDVGCGIGGPSGMIFDRYQPRRLIGVEYLAASAVTADERQRGRDQRPRFVQGDAHHLPMADGSVDVIFNLESALHYPDKDKFLGECARVLKPGGTLCLGDITTNLKVLFRAASLMNGMPSQFNSNLYLWSPDEYFEGFTKYGFDVVWHEEASRNVARSLTDGRRELSGLGFWKTRGFRARLVYLRFLEEHLQNAELLYDLFRVVKSDGTSNPKDHGHHGHGSSHGHGNGGHGKAGHH